MSVHTRAHLEAVRARFASPRCCAALAMHFRQERLLASATVADRASRRCRLGKEATKVSGKEEVQFGQLLALFSRLFGEVSEDCKKNGEVVRKTTKEAKIAKFCFVTFVDAASATAALAHDFRLEPVDEAKPWVQSLLARPFNGKGSGSWGGGKAGRGRSGGKGRGGRVAASERAAKQPPPSKKPRLREQGGGRGISDRLGPKVRR